jgi:hypothetical protein
MLLDFSSRGSKCSLPQMRITDNNCINCVDAHTKNHYSHFTDADANIANINIRICIFTPTTLHSFFDLKSWQWDPFPYLFRRKKKKKSLAMGNFFFLKDMELPLVKFHEHKILTS